MRGLDLNQRPSGYEPDELPDCSTPRYHRVPQAPAPTSVGWAALAPGGAAGGPSALRNPADLVWRSPLDSGPRDEKAAARFAPAAAFETVNGFTAPQAAMPGDDLLFQRLSVSTIGAVRFHGRVRDGIGWVTDAIATKQWSQRRGLNRCNR